MEKARRPAMVHHRRELAGGVPRRSADMCPNDFRDVYGSPPRTVIRQGLSSGDYEPRRLSLYEEVFHRPEIDSGCSEAAKQYGRSIPWIRIQEKQFYDDIFGSEFGNGEVCSGNFLRTSSRSLSKGKPTMTTSVGSTEENIDFPMQKNEFAVRAGGDSCEGDGDLSLCSAAKLRPITIPAKRYVSSSPSPVSGCFDDGNPSSYFTDFKDNCSSNRSSSTIQNLPHSSSPALRCFSSSEMSSMTEAILRSRIGCRNNNQWTPGVVDSPSSATSSAYVTSAVELKQISRGPDKAVLFMERDMDDGDEFMMEARRKEEELAGLAVDEAIAWAREKFLEARKVE